MVLMMSVDRKAQSIMDYERRKSLIIECVKIGDLTRDELVDIVSKHLKTSKTMVAIICNQLMDKGVLTCYRATRRRSCGRLGNIELLHYGELPKDFDATKVIRSRVEIQIEVAKSESRQVVNGHELHRHFFSASKQYLRDVEHPYYRAAA